MRKTAARQPRSRGPYLGNVYVLRPEIRSRDQLGTRGSETPTTQPIRTKVT